MDRAEKGEQLFMSGLNCAQAVLMAYEDEVGLDADALLGIGASLGGGMGRLREVCGTVSAVFVIAGLLYGPRDPSDRQAKAAHYKLIQELAAKFKEKNGSIICRELLGLGAGASPPVPEERTAAYYRRRPCGKYVRRAIEILEDYRNVQAAEIHEGLR